jgi:adenine deaminase
MLTVLFVMLPLAGCLSNDDSEAVDDENADLLDAVALLEEQIETRTSKSKRLRVFNGITSEMLRSWPMCSDQFE